MASKLLTSSMSGLQDSCDGCAPSLRSLPGWTRPRLRMDRWLGHARSRPRLRGARLFLKALEVDPSEVGQRIASRVLDEADFLFVLVQDLDRQPERLELLDEHLERLRHAGRLDLLALDDGLVRLHATHDVVGLHGEELLEDVRGAVRLERPDLHLAEALATELRLATQRLLGDEAVRAGGPRVNLVLHQVVELEHVDVADRHAMVELVAGSPVIQDRLAVLRQAGPLEGVLDVLLGGAIEDRGRRLEAEDLHGPPKVRLQHLADVHAARHAERVEHDVDRSAVGHERHVLDGQDLGDHALVAVASGHLVADRDLALLRHADANQAVDPRQQLVAVVAAELADVDHDAALAVRQAQAGVAHLAGLLTEDRPQQALLGRQLGLALRRDLADQDVAGLDLGALVDDPVLVEVAQALLAHVRDVARDLLGAQLRVAGLDLVLLDVDRREQVVLDEALAQHDGVLVVATLPGEEGDQDVLPQRHFAGIGAAAVREQLIDPYAVADVDDRALVDAGALVGAQELLEPIVVALVALVTLDRDVVGRDANHRSRVLGDEHALRVERGAVLDARAHNRGLRLEQRHRLPHHVRAHQRTVRVVVLE